MSAFNGRSDKTRVLVVEDEQNARDAVQRFLQFRGHEVTVAATAEDARRRAAQNPPDVLVCDWKLDGDSDGVDMAAALQCRFDMAVILITAHRIEDLKRKARTSGLSVSAYRRKPLSLARLADVIEGVA
ncbi:MAG: response regulator [Woeseiaceae bacterium]